jgi:hypothetical protein
MVGGGVGTTLPNLPVLEDQGGAASGAAGPASAPGSALGGPPGGPCIAVAEYQPDGRWLVNGRAMSREHAGVALEAAVTVAAAGHPHGAAQVPAAVPVTGASAGSGAATGQIIA